jgi:hypothetical protein
MIKENKKSKADVISSSILWFHLAVMLYLYVIVFWGADWCSSGLLWVANLLFFISYGCMFIIPFGALVLVFFNHKKKMWGELLVHTAMSAVQFLAVLLLFG